ncbi:hypothetical protein ACOSP7_018030 [Xanthoceras sorbifolium]
MDSWWKFLWRFRILLKVKKVVHWTQLFLKDFQEASAEQPISRPLNIVVARWKPPDIGQLKLNTDTAVDYAYQLIGCGLVIRDHLRQVLGSSW